MKDRERVKEYREQFNHLARDRQTWEDRFREINRFVLPGRGSLEEGLGYSPNRLNERRADVIDTTAAHSIRVLAAGMQGGMTSPAMPWFLSRMADESLNDHRAVREWLQGVEKAIYHSFARSNLYHCIHTLYEELAAFGTAVMYAEEHEVTGIRFRTLNAGEYYLSADHENRIDTVFRRMYLTARQLVRRFGEDRVSDEVRRAASSSPYEWFPVIHLVRPREERKRDRIDARNKPFESVYFEELSEGAILWEGGYDEFPFMTPRWNVYGSDVYGRSPGMDVLPDVKMLQEMQITSLKALHKMVDPPMIIPAGWRGPIKTFPGGQTMAQKENQEGLRPLYEVKFDLSPAEAKIEQVRMRIREGFYNDLFLMILETPNMTATEVLERRQEKMLMLGPVVERQQSELLDPLIRRTFGILFRQGRIPEPPAHVVGKDMRVEYVSILAHAQKSERSQNIRGLAGFVEELGKAQKASGIPPDVWDKIDTDEMVDEFGKAMGASPKLIRSKDEVAGIRRNRAEQEAVVRVGQDALTAIRGAKDLSEIDTESKNALTDIAAGMGANG